MGAPMLDEFEPGTLDRDRLRQLVHIYVGARFAWAETPDGDAQRQAGWSIGELAQTDPETCWRLIETACDEPLTDDDLAYLSAGLFGDLMGAHGEQFIGRVEVFTRLHERMRFVVAAAWKGAMTEPVWGRISSLRERLGIVPL